MSINPIIAQNAQDSQREPARGRQERASYLRLRSASSAQRPAGLRLGGMKLPGARRARRTVCVEDGG